MALAALADLAPTLKEAELRVLLELTRRALDAPHHTIRASSRDLAEACKIARSKAIPALATLSSRGLITVHQGTATRPSSYYVAHLDTAHITPAGGPLSGPPPATAYANSEVDLRHRLFVIED